MTTASQVLKVCQSQVGIKESPAGSNNVKYNTWFYGHPVHGSNYAWCATFLDFCFWKAGGNNLFPHNASAAYSQDEIVSRCHGKWVMRKTGSKTTKKKGFKDARPADVVCFDFGKGDSYRRHIGIVLRKSGDNYICIEGNTSAGSSGSQSNGGMVAMRTRHYTEVCSIARPAYSGKGGDVPLEPLVIDGGMGYETASRLQRWLGVAEDGEIGRKTIMALQARIGAVTDGLWGKATTKCLQRFLNAHDNAKLTVDGECGKATIRALQRFLNKVVTK